MNPLDATKSGFLVCIAVCVFIYAFIYLKDTLSEEPNEQKFNANIVECGFYPDELCSALFVGKTAAFKIGNFCQNTYQPKTLSCIQTSCNCSMVLKTLHFITRPLSDEEGNFSLAYIITIHKELEMFVKLLRAIYMPQNIYCIHVDEKSPKDYKAAVQNIVNCFENIFISSKRENVVYAGFSRLQADINCMRDLVHSKIKWNYVINLCGQDYPIKTNKDIIQYIKSKWNGKNMTPGVVQPLHMKHRTQMLQGLHPMQTGKETYEPLNGKIKKEPYTKAAKVITSETFVSMDWGICSGLLSPLICLPTNLSLQHIHLLWTAWRDATGLKYCTRQKSRLKITGVFRKRTTST
ncbi:putative beta-1,3-galactosyl-O-glycosyl-glycoprotein beta-1,6-N-acetylglucosaminyltransferase 7 isoform X2 [Calonectris borealis]|uniref:putative beta-1,3-galactosyl-O-glycosyl-glycoprotein beta-1,6-N-acetylglucosaminyltransferase 7 isoform X2 n=1 Tax=Calonectris borealis TaxID=1323832 RepID=UPI003F4BD05A